MTMPKKEDFAEAARDLEIAAMWMRDFADGRKRITKTNVLSACHSARLAGEEGLNNVARIRSEVSSN